MAAVAVRIAYTYFARRHGAPLGQSFAAQLGEAQQFEEQPQYTDMSCFDEKKTTTAIQSMDDAPPAYLEHWQEEEQTLAKADSAVAHFTQYLTTEDETSLEITEARIPHRSGSFVVTDTKTGRELFFVDREFGSLHHRQTVTDAQTGQALFDIKRRIGQLPISYQFEDLVTGSCIFDLQGNFFIPGTGSRATGYTINNAAMNHDGQPDGINSISTLSMHSSWKNKSAQITDKHTGRILASMGCNIFDKANLVGGRRTYKVQVQKNVDLAIIVGMLVSLDARSG